MEPQEAIHNRAEERRATVLRMAEQGHRQKDIAKDLGITPARVCQLLKAAVAFPSADPLRRIGYATLFGLLASTGMRVSEPLRLGVADVDLDGGVLRVLETKFRKSRLVPMHPTVNEAMRRYAAQHPAARTAVLMLTCPSRAERAR